MNLSNKNPRQAALAAFAFSALAVVVLAGCSHAGNAAMQAPEVSVAQVAVKQVSAWDEYSGRIEAVQNVELRPRVSGYIDSVNYREGQHVDKGDVLFTIDARTYRAALAQAEAQLARAHAQVEQASSEAVRGKALVEQKAISTEAYEQRKAAADSAQADLQAAQAAVDSARLNLEWTQVRAPISGRASRAMVTAGNLVGAEGNNVLTTLVSEDKVYVYFDADESAFLRYQQMARDGKRGGDADGKLPVRIALADEQGFPHTGAVDFLDNQVDSNTGTIRVRAVLDNGKREYVPGLFARVRLLGGGAFDAMLIDDKAVLTDQDRKYVYVVDKDGKAQRRDVQLGRQADGLRIVEKGLQAGDKVIVAGVQKVVMPGMPVDAKPVPMQAQASPNLPMN